MKINKREFMLWLDALVSEEYKQTRNKLQNENGFCCLGVACEVLIPKSKQQKNDLGHLSGPYPHCQEHAPKWLQRVVWIITREYKIDITELNDYEHLSFTEIADILYSIYILKEGRI